MASEEPRLVAFKRDDPIVIGSAAPESMQDIDNMKKFGDQVLGIVNKYPGLNLMLTFERVEYLSSAALTELIRIHDVLSKQKGQLTLGGLSQDMYKVFEVTKLDQMFGLSPGEDVGSSIQRFKATVQRDLDPLREEPR